MQPSDRRLRRQINLIVEIDKLKQIFRQTRLIDQSRQENDTELGEDILPSKAYRV